MESNGFMIGPGIKEIWEIKVGTPTVGHPVVTNWAAQYLQYQPIGRWNISKILNKISWIRGRPRLYLPPRLGPAWVWLRPPVRPQCPRLCIRSPPATTSPTKYEKKSSFLRSPISCMIWPQNVWEESEIQGPIMIQSKKSRPISQKAHAHGSVGSKRQLRCFFRRQL